MWCDLFEQFEQFRSDARLKNVEARQVSARTGQAYHQAIHDRIAAGAQLLRLAPDVILANGTPAARTMQQLTRTVPVIFIAGSDPVVDGLVTSLARPGGNLTGL